MSMLKPDYNGAICRSIWQVPWVFGVEEMAGYCYSEARLALSKDDPRLAEAMSYNALRGNSRSND